MARENGGFEVRVAIVLLSAMLAGAGCAGWPGDWNAHRDARHPTAAERAEVEAVLVSAGYRAWESVRFDDGVWLVQNAWNADGEKQDLHLDAELTTIVAREG